MKRNAIACAVVSALGLFVTTQEAGAAAFALYENGASGLGNAYAGAAAVAEEYGFPDIDGRQPRALTLADV